MGQNSRYPGHGIDRAIEAVTVRAKPISLSDAELDLEHHPPRRAAQPIPVRAWVRFPENAIQPDAEAIAWTDKAVQVRWTGHANEVYTAWVWASAVERREPRTR
ncbi:hypothetical protein [Homoserinimonas sp. A520]